MILYYIQLAAVVALVGIYAINIFYICYNEKHPEYGKRKKNY